MTTRPIILDLFCGGGGSAWGYIQAGFDVIGIDIAKRKNYPGQFIQSDVFSFDYSTLSFDAVHASPPCQAYSVSTAPQKHLGKEYPDLVAPTRALLNHLAGPFVIENVVGSPLLTTVELCGSMFGLKVFRHRLFETSFIAFQPVHKKHLNRIGDNGFVTVAGNADCSKTVWREAMGIEHKMSRKEIAQSIPPSYTCYLGRQLLAFL